jgi:hypothetical protein
MNGAADSSMLKFADLAEENCRLMLRSLYCKDRMPYRTEEIMNKAFCPKCDMELNPLFAFEREISGWKARTHRLWHCPRCSGYLTPEARLTGRETRILTGSDYGLYRNVDREPSATRTRGGEGCDRLLLWLDGAVRDEGNVDGRDE